MRILAIEQSSRLGSIALLEDERVLFEDQWDGSRWHSQEAYLILRERIGQGDLDLRTVDLIAVGIGPGSFSGARMAVATARAMALPEGKEVYAVSSGEALAWTTFGSVMQGSVIPLGDARRERVWLGRFERGEGFISQVTPWSLIDTADLAVHLPPDSVVVTPDWDRLAERLQSIVPQGVVLQEGQHAPTARAVGQVAFQRRSRGRLSESPVPIYLHPAVFVEPRYPS
jgi:tRNA threonylcarbamoyladenosine biosynthesis protein TsaB